MTLSQSGDDLSRLLASLDAFADGRVAHDVAVGLAQAAQGLVRDTFASSKSPEGRRWAPLKRPRPGGPVLVKRGQLAAAAARYTVDRSGFVFEGVPAFADYGKYHQSNQPRTSNLPRRQFYPDDVSVLPFGWVIVMQGAADNAVREWLP